MHKYPWLRLLSASLPLSHALLVFEGNTSVFSIPLYGDLIWNENFKIENASLVNIMLDITTFDYCNLEQYSRESVSQLLELHHVDPSTRWIAYYDAQIYINVCRERVEASKKDTYQFMWHMLLAPNMEDLGCEGFITPYFLDASKYLALPSLDPSSGTIFGRSVKIFSAFIDDYDSAASLFIDTIMKESLSRKTPLVVRNATGDPYFLDYAVRNWRSSYNVLSTVLSIFSLLCLWDSCRVFIKFYRIQKGKPPLRSYCTFSLVMIVLSNAAMFVKSIDIIGARGIYRSIFSRSLFSSTGAVSLSVLLSTYLFWIEASTQIDSSLIMVRRQPGLKGRISVLLLFLGMIALDFSVSILGYYGRLPGTNIAEIPVVIATGLYVMMASFGFWVFCKVSKTVGKVQDLVEEVKIHETETPAATAIIPNDDSSKSTVGGQAGPVVKMVPKLGQMRKTIASKRSSLTILQESVSMNVRESLNLDNMLPASMRQSHSDMMSSAGTITTIAQEGGAKHPSSLIDGGGGGKGTKKPSLDGGSSVKRPSMDMQVRPHPDTPAHKDQKNTFFDNGPPKMHRASFIAPVKESSEHENTHGLSTDMESGREDKESVGKESGRERSSSIEKEEESTGKSTGPKHNSSGDGKGAINPSTAATNKTSIPKQAAGKGGNGNATTPRAAAAGGGKKPQPLLLTVSAKAVRAVSWIVLLSLFLLLQVSVIVMIGLNWPYSSADSFGYIFCGFCLVEQLIAYAEVRLLSISMQPLQS